MIIFGNEGILIGSNKAELQPLKRWEVWYQTPFGLHELYDEAYQRCVDNDLSPQLIIRPVAVAVGDDAYYEAVG